MSTSTRSPAPTVEHDDEGLPELDFTKPLISSSWGRKGSGKSVSNRRLYDSWPLDKLCIDVNGNADPGPDAERVAAADLRSRWPEAPAVPLGEAKRGPRNLWFRADPGSDTYDDDLDRAVGMAMFPQDHRTLVWCGEVGEFMPNAASTGPAMRRLLMQNRHHKVTALFDGPRPVNVNPLVLAQSDYVFVYHLPNPADRERIANTVGYPPQRFHAECEETWKRGKHWFLL